MIISAKDYQYFMRSHGSAMGIIHQQVPVPGLAPEPYREIIREEVRAGATTDERLAAITGPEV